MKICLISPFPPQKTGTAEYSFYLVKSIEEACKDCEIYVLAGSLGDEPTVTRLSRKVKLFRTWKTSSFIDIIQSILMVLRVLISVKPEVLHIQYHFIREQGGSIGEPFFILIFLAKRILRKLKIVISLHDFWLPQEAERRAYEITRSRVLAKLFKFYYTTYVRMFLNTPDAIISVVHIRGSPVTEYIKRYTKRNVVEVPHGLPYVMQRDNFSKLKCKEALGVSNKFVVLLFGYIRRTKGYEYVFKAIKKIFSTQPWMKEKIEVLVTGATVRLEDEEYLKYLEKLVSELDLTENVTINAQYLSENELGQFFGAAELTIISYTRRVGPSGVFTYALAYEVPSIIAYDNRYLTQKMDLPAYTVGLDVDEISSAILDLMTNKDEYSRLIQKVKKYKISISGREIAMLHMNLFKLLVNAH